MGKRIYSQGRVVAYEMNNSDLVKTMGGREWKFKALVTSMTEQQQKDLKAECKKKGYYTKILRRQGCEWELWVSKK